MRTTGTSTDAERIIRAMIDSHSKSLKLAGSVLVALQFGLIAWHLALAASAILQGHIPLGSWLLGGAAVALAVWTLGHNRMGNFNIHPVPKTSGVLVTSGPYRWIRHPMYTTVLMGAAALAWMPGTALAWLVWAALGVVLFAKLTLEERWLRERYASYDAYKNVSKRLLPYIF
jgi:protein-S-isoprenylcysteine O-methyltransferase Ste14